MNYDPHNNLPLTTSLKPLIQDSCKTAPTHPYARAVNAWLEGNGELCQKVLGCLGINRLYVKQMRADIDHKHLRQAASWIRYMCSHHEIEDPDGIRFDRLAYLYEKSTGADKQNIDQTMIAITGLTLFECLDRSIESTSYDLSDLQIRSKDNGLGPEQEAFCDYSKSWLPVHRLPYRFSLKHSYQVFGGNSEDPTPEFQTDTLYHSHSLDPVLHEAVKTCLAHQNMQSCLHVEYYGQTILEAQKHKGVFGWIHPLADLETCPAYWRDEFPFEISKLMRQVMQIELKAGASHLQDRLFEMDLGI